MTIDTHKIARDITDDTTAHAAVTTAELIDAILDEMQSPHRRAEFVGALRKELAKRGWRFERGPQLMLFGLLEIGECFRMLNGELYCKTAPIKHTDPRDGTSIVLNAYHLETNRQTFVEEREKVEQLGYLMPGFP